MSVLNEILETGTVGGTPLRDHISAEEGEFLRRLVTDTQPAVSLEVGLACGISALYICEALPDGARHIALDPLQTTLWDRAGLRALERAGHSVEFHEEGSEFALPRLARDGLQVEFAFIDGMHVFDHALLDFFYLDRMLTIGGVVAFDDADLPAVHTVIRYALTNRRYEVRACLASSSRRSRSNRVVARLAATRAGRVLRPDLRRPDAALSLVLGSRCVALRKLGDDNREWNHHVEF